MRKPKAQGNAQLPLDDPIRNCGLFADHFLKDKLPGLAEWQGLECLEEAFAEVKAAFEQAAGEFTDRTNEAQTEDKLIRPLLNVLWGHGCYEVQEGIQFEHGSWALQRRWYCRGDPVGE